MFNDSLIFNALMRFVGGATVDKTYFVKVQVGHPQKTYLKRSILALLQYLIFFPENKQ